MFGVVGVAAVDVIDTDQDQLVDLLQLLLKHSRPLVSLCSHKSQNVLERHHRPYTSLFHMKIKGWHVDSTYLNFIIAGKFGP